MKLKSLFPVCLTLALAACSSNPSSVIVAPQVYTPAHNVYLDQQVQLQVNDLRPQQHIVQVLRVDEPAELYSPANDISSALKSSLSSEWKKQGLAISQVAQVSITVFIDAALVSVQQDTIKYKANSDVRFRVQVTKGDKNIISNFKSKGSSNGPLSADIAVLERDFNQQVGKVITEIMKNTDIQAFIKT